MFNLLNAKFVIINLSYAFLAMFVMYLQTTIEYTTLLPHPTLTGVGLVMTSIGGVMSWLWERKKNPNASLRTNISFAIGMGVLVGLLSYDYLVVKNHLVNLWLGCLIAAGFANQVCWGLVSILVRKKISDIFKLEEDGQTRSTSTNGSPIIARNQITDRRKINEMVPVKNSLSSNFDSCDDNSILPEQRVEIQQRKSS